MGFYRERGCGVERQRLKGERVVEENSLNYYSRIIFPFPFSIKMKYICEIIMNNSFVVVLLLLYHHIFSISPKQNLAYNLFNLLHNLWLLSLF